MDISPEFDGWFVFDPLREYHRLRLTSVGCRFEEKEGQGRGGFFGFGWERGMAVVIALLLLL